VRQPYVIFVVDCKQESRLPECIPELGYFNQDTNDYGLSWREELPAEGELEDFELTPWRYRYQYHPVSTFPKKGIQTFLTKKKGRV